MEVMSEMFWGPVCVSYIQKHVQYEQLLTLHGDSLSQEISVFILCYSVFFVVFFNVEHKMRIFKKCSCGSVTKKKKKKEECQKYSSLYCNSSEDMQYIYILYFSKL